MTLKTYDSGEFRFTQINPKIHLARLMLKLFGRNGKQATWPGKARGRRQLSPDSTRRGQHLDSIFYFCGLQMTTAIQTHFASMKTLNFCESQRKRERRSGFWIGTLFAY